MINCSTQFCRKETALIYLGMPLCNDHWLKLADADVAEEKDILKTLGFERTGGMVRELTKEQTDDERRSVAEPPTIADAPPGNPGGGPDGLGATGSTTPSP